MTMNIEKIHRKTVVEHVMERVKELIASGQFKVNDKIPTEQELANMFGIARNSIREAIKIFQYLGVLDSQTGRGTYVCDRAKISSEALTWSILLGENDLFEMVHLRFVLEQEGLRRLVALKTEKPESFAPFVAALAQEVDNMKKAVQSMDLEALIQADYAFHGTIITASGNSLFTAIYHTLRSFMHEEIKKTYMGVDTRKSFREHQEFIDLIQAGDIDRALRLHAKHIQSITAKLRESLTK
jgi:GntR family transcriptional repressor for pyruvate dehydrogenase complex